ncbi:hypothetical protein ACFCP7_09200 [Paenibacillus elgii]
MAEKKQNIDVLKFLQQFWGAEALERTDEAGQQYAAGVSYGFKLAAAILKAQK